MKHKLLNPLRLLLVVICMLGLAAEGQEVEVNKIVYTLNPTNKTAKVCEGQYQLYEFENLEEVTIVPYVTYEGETYTVTEIGTAAFYYMDFLKKINLPETLKKIGEAAFSYSGIETMVIPNSVDTIQQAAFYECSQLKSCKLSENMTVIAPGLFAHCTSLESIEFPNSITRFVKENPIPTEEDWGFFDDPTFFVTVGLTFEGCNNLKTVILPKNLTNIPQNTFLHCWSLNHIEIPHSVSWLGIQAFQECALEELDGIPDYVQSWGHEFVNPNQIEDFFNSTFKYVKSYNENPFPGYVFLSTNGVPCFSCPIYVPKGLSGIYNNIEQWNCFSRVVEATPVEMEDGWRTFCAYEDLDFSAVEGLEAYIATEYQDGKVLMEPIEQVPAGTGVVLKGVPGFYEIPYPDQDEALEPVDNLLVGLNYGERIQAETENGQCNLFFNDATEMASLFYGPFMEAERAPRLNAEGEQPMFAPADGARLPYHRAYLQLPASEAGKTVEMVFGTLTGIEEVEAAQPQTDGAIYNLQGQRVVNPGPGIYIQNGRKFVVR